MRINIQTRGRVRNTDLVQQIDCPLTTGLLIPTLVHLNRFHNLETDGVTRVEAGHRILEDHRHFGTDQVAALFF